MMSRWLRNLCGGAVVAAPFTLVTLAALAEPPIGHGQNRSYGNSVSAGICLDIENGFTCRDLMAWENYDVKGSYQYTEASISLYQRRDDPNDGSWSNGYRYLSCPVDEKALSTHPNGVSLVANLDPEGPGCYSYGYLESWDPVNEYQFVPWPWPVPRDISGEWTDPFRYGQSAINQKDTIYDGGTDTTSTVARHCNYSWGDMMRSGGFTIGIRSFAFEGPEGPAYSNYSISSCNDRDMQR